MSRMIEMSNFIHAQNDSKGICTSNSDIFLSGFCYFLSVVVFAFRKELRFLFRVPTALEFSLFIFSPG